MSYIKKIRIRNFKSLEDITVDIKPLTFLFGPNSSGKSSFLKALMFLYTNLFSNDSFSYDWLAFYMQRENSNKGNTIYNISENVDLVSFIDVLNKKCVKTVKKPSSVFKTETACDSIIFDITLSGKIEFPTKEILNPKKFIESLRKYNLNNTLLKNALLKIPLSDTNKFRSEVGKIGEDFQLNNIFFTKQDFSYKISVEFNKDDKLQLSIKNLSKISFKPFLSEFVFSPFQSEQISELVSPSSNLLQKIEDLFKRHVYNEPLTETENGKLKNFHGETYSKDDVKVHQAKIEEAEIEWWVKKNTFPKFNKLTQEKK